jgi:alkylhydroperoxidase family enzyme
VPRLRQVSKEEAEAPIVKTMYDFLFEGRDPVGQPGTWTGSPGDWWTVFALVPDVLEHAVAGFALYQSSKRRLDPVLRELGQIRAGWAAGSQFVFSQHCKSLRDLGVAEEKIESIPTWTVASCYDETERLVLAYTDCLVYEHGRVPDALFGELRNQLSDEEILELTYITALYFQHAVMSRALRTEFDDRQDPVVEVPGPEGASAMHPGSPARPPTQ